MPIVSCVSAVPFVFMRKIPAVTPSHLVKKIVGSRAVIKSAKELLRPVLSVTVRTAA